MHTATMPMLILSIAFIILFTHTPITTSLQCQQGAETCTAKSYEVCRSFNSDGYTACVSKYFCQSPVNTCNHNYMYYRNHDDSDGYACCCDNVDFCNKKEMMKDFKNCSNAPQTQKKLHVDSCKFDNYNPVLTCHNPKNAKGEEKCEEKTDDHQLVCGSKWTHGWNETKYGCMQVYVEGQQGHACGYLPMNTCMNYPDKYNTTVCCCDTNHCNTPEKLEKLPMLKEGEDIQPTTTTTEKMTTENDVDDDKSDEDDKENDDDKEKSSASISGSPSQFLLITGIAFFLLLIGGFFPSIGGHFGAF